MINKFRGKRLDNNNWVCGNLIIDEISGKHYIVLSVNESEKISMEGCLFVVVSEVDPETVGQYTELPDKNKKEIYKGDILLIVSELYSNFGRKATGKFGKTIEEVIWLEDSWGTRVIESDTIVKGYESKGLKSSAKYGEVIGTKFDNPELEVNHAE